MGQEDVFGGVLHSKITFLDFKNIDLIIVEKFAFFQRGLSMVVVKVLKFLYPFLLGQRSQEEVFGNFLERQLVF